MKEKLYLNGINIQWPISSLIISKEKTVETRTYPLPLHYQNRDLLLIETPGRAGKFKARGIAIIRFSDCFKYKSKKEFEKDFKNHKVDSLSQWAWSEKAKYGWRISKIIKLNEYIEVPRHRGIIFTSEIEISLKLLQTNTQNQSHRTLK